MEPHLIPRSLEVKGHKFREILEQLDLAWGVSEVWWQVLRKRLQWKQSNEPAEASGDDNLQPIIERVMREFPWQDWIPSRTSLEITAECQRSRLRNAKRVRNCILNALETADRPSPQATLSIKASVFRDTLAIYLPLGFEPWSHRSYKSGLNHPASLREDYAQTIIGLMAQWLGCQPTELPDEVYVPFAGSGTFVFEYCTMRWQMGHALVAKHDLFAASPGAPKLTLDNLRKRARSRVLDAASKSPLCALAVDLEAGHCDAVGKTFNAFRALLPEAAADKLKCTVLKADFFKLGPQQIRHAFKQESPRYPSDQRLCILLNPPFGERLTGHYAPRLFEQIAKHLAQLAMEMSFCAAAICPSATAAKAFTQQLAQAGLRWTELPFSYGSLDARVVFMRSGAY